MIERCVCGGEVGFAVRGGRARALCPDCGWKSPWYLSGDAAQMAWNGIMRAVRREREAREMLQRVLDYDRPSNEELEEWLTKKS